MDCKFTPLGKYQIVCSVCKQPFPKINGWETMRKACSGPAAVPGTVTKEWKLTGQDATSSRAGPCKFQGDLLRIQTCKPCQARGKGEVSIFACSQYGECTLENTGIQPKLQGCSTCQKYAPKPIEPTPFNGPIVRNLLMFIYPKGPEWRRNLDQACRRMSLFNGKRIFAMATDATTAVPGEVIMALEGIDCEVMHFTNQRALGEVVAFKSLLSKVESLNPNEITFYCHAKGVTKPPADVQLPAVRNWADAMYEACLDDMGAVESHIEAGKTFVGAFRALGQQFHSIEIPFHNWHYPGTFYWFRNAEIFADSKWSAIPQTFWGTEAWPGTRVGVSQSACLVLDKVPLAQLYLSPYWATTAQPALDHWRRKRIETPMPDVAMPAGKKPIRVAFIGPAAQLGGGERWEISLGRYLPAMSDGQVQVSGFIAAEDRNIEPQTVRELSQIAPVWVNRNGNESSEQCDALMQSTDIVICWGVGDVRHLLRAFRGPVVWVAHGACEWTYKHSEAANNLGLVQHWAAVSYVARDSMPEVFRDSVTIIENGIDPERCLPSRGRAFIREKWGVTNDQITVGFMGRFDWDKNPMALADAISHLPPEYVGIMIGNGIHEGECRDKARKLCGDRVKFVGRHSHIGDCLAGLDVFLLASEKEGDGLVRKEAAFARVPIVCTPTGDIPRYQAEQPVAWIVPVGADGAAIAAKIEEAVASKSETTAMLTRFEGVVRDQFTAPAMAARWADYLTGIMIRH